MQICILHLIAANSHAYDQQTTPGSSPLAQCSWVHELSLVNNLPILGPSLNHLNAFDVNLDATSFCTARTY
jgi:hypothetical protein